MPATFYSGPDWEASADISVRRNVQADDLWPHSGQGPAGKDALENGLHPILAIGNDAVAEGRAATGPVGVMVTYDSDLERAVMEVGPRVVVRQYVSNILTYAAGAAATFETSYQIGMSVYVDDSDDLGAGVTVSLSPLNDAGLPNVLAGELFYDQTEDESAAVGGANVDAWPKTAPNSNSELLVCVMLK